MGRLSGCSACTRTSLEHRRLQEALQESEAVFRLLTDTTRALIYILQDSHLVYANPSLINFSGYTAEELMAMNIYDTIHPYDRARVEEFTRHWLSDDTVPKRYEARVITRSGEEKWIEISPVIIEFHGQPAILGTAYDITERKIAEERIKISEERYRTLYNAITDGLLVQRLNPDDTPGLFIEANEVICRRLGYTREELLEKSPIDIDVPMSEGGTDPAPIFAALIAGQEVTFEQVHVARNGRHIPVEIHGNPITLQGQPGVMSLVRDISERKVAEESLRKSEATLRSILKSAPTGIGLVVNHLLVEVNDQILKMTGYRRDELLGQSSRVLYPSQEDYDIAGQVIYAQIHELGVGSLETRWRRKDGSVFDVLLSSTPIDPSSFSAGVTFTALISPRSKRRIGRRISS